MSRRRLINVAGFLVCAALMGYALHVQYDLFLDPCPLCIFQRLGVILLGLSFLAAAIHNPRGGGRYAYAVAIALSALLTAGLALRHLYVQSLPPGSIPSCGAPLALMLRFSPPLEVIRTVLTGSGECGVVNWRFLGLAMPGWVLIWALLLGGAGTLGNLRSGASAAR